VVTFEGFDPAHEGHREALTTLANGYMGTRGSAPESRADAAHYPGTYLSGVYNRLTSVVEGVALDEEQLVNVPNWLPIDLRIENGEWWSAGGLEVGRERSDHAATRVLRKGLSGSSAGVGCAGRSGHEQHAKQGGENQEQAG